MKEKICPNCGVVLDRGIEICPLCFNDPAKGPGKAKEGISPNYPSEILKMNARERAKYNWELSGLIAASGILVSLIVDLVLGKGLSWSLYSVTVITGIWVYITLFVFWLRRPWLLVTGLTLTTLAIQVVIDLLVLPVHWFVILSIPFTISFFILLSLVVILSRRARYKGFNILALAFIGLSIQCFVFEVFTDLYLDGVVSIDWSAITASAIIPFSAILMFIHYRLKRGLNLKSYFHV